MQIAQRLALLIPALLLLASTSRADTNQPTAGPEQKFVAILVWGTDGGKPEGKEKELKDVEESLKPKFAHIFKWKNYYEVNRKPFAVKTGEKKDLKLSEKCSLKIHQTAKEGMQIELVGEGKSVHSTQSMPLKDVLILGGPDKNETAWFVVIKPE